MSPYRFTRLIAAAALACAIAATVGCAGRPGAAAPAPTSTVVATPEPEPIASAARTNPPKLTQQEFGAFTRAQLAQLCIEATVAVFNEDVQFDIENTRVERRAVAPEWLVIVPAMTSGTRGQSLCTIGGSPLAPVLELSSGSIEMLAEDQLERLLRGENEGGDQ